MGINKDVQKISLVFTLLLAGLAAIGPFSIDTFLPAMGAISQDLKSTQEQTQLIISAYMLCFGITNLLHGAVSDAIGRRKVIIITLALFALASIGCVFVNTLEGLLMMRAIQGVCGGAGMVVGRAIIRDCFDGVRAQKIMSQVTMLFSLAPALAPVLGGQLFTLLGWRSIFVFLCILGLLLLAASWFKLPETHPVDKRSTFSFRALFMNYWQVLKRAEFFLLSLALAFNSAGMFVFIPSSHMLLVEHLGIPETQFLWLFGPLVMGIMLGAFLSGRLAGRITVRNTVSFGYVTMILATLTTTLYHAFFAPTLLMVVVPLGFYCMGMSIVAPSMMIALMDLFPKLRGTASSLQGCMQSIAGGIVAGLIVPLVWHTVFGLTATMLTFCLLGLTMNGCYFLKNKTIIVG